MDSFWLVLAFSAGACAGFLLFAVLQASREATSKARTAANAGLLPFELEGDTITRF